MDDCDEAQLSSKTVLPNSRDGITLPRLEIANLKTILFVMSEKVMDRKDKRLFEKEISHQKVSNDMKEVRAKVGFTFSNRKK